MPVTPNTTYNIGVGPSMPETSFTPGAPPPPPPTFTFMPPAPLTVTVVAASLTGKNFALVSTDKTITGTVVDSSGEGNCQLLEYSVVQRRAPPGPRADLARADKATLPAPSL